MNLKKRKPFPGSLPEANPEPQTTEPKGPRSSNSSPLVLLKNRTVLGILLIGISLILAFVVYPVVQVRATAGRALVVVASTSIPKGTRIEQSMVVTREVGAYNLPAGLHADSSLVVGQYTAEHIFAGDYLSEAKVSPTPPYDNAYLHNLPEGKFAISIDISSLAGGLSGKLRAGDIVSVLSVPSAGNDIETAIQYPELQYLLVLAVSNGNTQDIDDALVKQDDIENTARQIVTTTLLADEQQVLRLAGLNRGSVLHLALVTRGDDTKAQQLLDLQEQYLQERETPGSSNTVILPPAAPEGEEVAS